MVSREEVDPDVLLPVWDSKGTDIGSVISSYAIWARTATPQADSYVQCYPRAKAKALSATQEKGCTPLISTVY